MKRTFFLFFILFTASLQAQTWFIPWDFSNLSSSSSGTATNITVSGNMAVTNTPNVNVANSYLWVQETNRFTNGLVNGGWVYITNSYVGVTNTYFSVGVTNIGFSVTNIAAIAGNVNITNSVVIPVHITNTLANPVNVAGNVNVTNSVILAVYNTNTLALPVNVAGPVSITNIPTVVVSNTTPIFVTNTYNLKVTSTNDTHAMRYGPSFLFNAATINSNSPAIDVSWYNKHSFQYWLTGTITNLYLYFESSLDGTNYNKEILLIPTYTTNALVPLAGMTKYLRATATNGPLGAAYGGSVNVMLMSGN